MSDPNVRELLPALIAKGWLEITDPNVTLEDLQRWPSDKPLPVQLTQAAQQESDRGGGNGQPI